MRYLGFDSEKGEQWDETSWCCDKLRQAIPRVVDFLKFDQVFVIFEICTMPQNVGDPTGSHRTNAIDYCPFCGKKIVVEIAEKEKV